MGWLTPAKPQLLPLPMGLRVPVGNFTPAASKSLDEESGSTWWDPKSAVSAVMHTSHDAAGASLGH